MKNFVAKSSLLLLLTLLVSCYTFTGNSLNHDEKTILIKNFPNNAAMVNPTLSQDFTTMLQNRFLRNTSLKGATAPNPAMSI